MSIENKIQDIIYKEMKSLLDNLEEEFEEKYSKKENNWILHCFKPDIISSMVFVSSFESKYGNMFEKIAFEVAKLKFGSDNVKNIYKSDSITDEEYNKFLEEFDHNNKQFIITKFDENSGILNDFREKHRGDGRKRIPSTLNQKVIKDLLTYELKKSEKVHEQPVDLLIYDSENDIYEIYEIKAGGDLDSTNSKGNIVKLLRIYIALGKDNCNIYFATLYNKDGDDNNWSGAVKSQISGDALLIGGDFWNKILPNEISFEKFKKIYLGVCEELKMDEKIRKLIN